VKPVVLHKDANSDEVYHGDIYGKGAFFMHTLRYIIGDSIFFPTLKTLATSPAYTYDSLPDTDDVERLFSKSSGRDLKPLFDLFLRTTNKLEINVKQRGDKMYHIRLTNFDGSLPIEITTDRGKATHLIGKEGIDLQSGIMPQIDMTGYYIKKVSLEY
jgi:aminopeptidase N